MADLVRIAAIKSELQADPEALGYTAQATYDAADAPTQETLALADLALLSAVGQVVDVQTLSASQLFEAIDATEWGTVLDATDRDNVRLVLSLGDNIQIAPGTKARAMLSNALAGATSSLANLGVLGSRTVSRVEELAFGRVTAGDIQNARVL